MNEMLTLSGFSQKARNLFSSIEKPAVKVDKQTGDKQRKGKRVVTH
jgi:hypothetical protein